MTSFVYDFKDIASRMKGELKAAPEPYCVEVSASVSLTCLACNGSGQDKTKYWNVPCPYCNGMGIIT